MGFGPKTAAGGGPSRGSLVRAESPMGNGVSSAANSSKSAKALFKEIDVNGDGALVLDELVAAAKQYGSDLEAEWPEGAIKELLSQHDCNKDGSAFARRHTDSICFCAHDSSHQIPVR